MRLLNICVMAALLLMLAWSGQASMSQFAGTWSNTDPATRGITSLQINVSGSSAQVHAWGSCHPTDCDWGSVQAQAFASGVSSNIASDASTLIAVFNSGFSETTLVITPYGSGLHVDSYDRFLDGSGRSNYIASYTFQRQAAPGGTSPGGAAPGGTSPSGAAPGGTSPGGASTTIDLTGVWNCDDGGKYYVRQLGTTVWWFGEQSPSNPTWTNVMQGTVSGNIIYADWSDVPLGSVMSSGNLVLQIVSNYQLTAISKTGGFGGSTWTR
jgi:hypothetical protein